jgi:dipeptidyl aminopeptidase/acylaminoacyl peptidase
MTGRRLRDVLCWAACVLLIAGEGEAASGQLSASVFARSPQFSHAALSPDGSNLSYVRSNGDRETLVSRRLRDGAEHELWSVDSRRERIGWCDWGGNRHLLCGTSVSIRRPNGVVQSTHLYAVDARGASVRELNRRFEHGIRDHVISLPSADNPLALIQHDPSGRGYPEVAALDIQTGQLERVARSQPPIRRWLTDHRGQLALGIAFDATSASIYVPSPDSDSWRVLLEQELADVHAIAPLAVGNNLLYALKHHQGRTGLFSIDLRAQSAAADLVLADPHFDIAGPVVLDEESGQLLGVHIIRASSQYVAVDEDEMRRQRLLAERFIFAFPQVIDRSQDGRWWLVEASSDVDPPSLYLFDARDMQLSAIGHSYPDLEDITLAPMESVVYKARDGQLIPAYLTRHEGARGKPVPAIVLPHGGPESRVWRRFDPLVQFLASRGFAVLQMNYRGSLGYGAGFAAAGVGQWGGVIHNDITDGARWLVEQRIADPTRTCIVGSSFGGYAAMLAAMRESEWYACAASFAGISDLLSFSQHTRRLPDAQTWNQRLGEDSRALWQMSPISRVRSSETPLLLMHGLLDAIVPASQSRRLARAARNEGKHVELILRSDCDHEMTVESCRSAFYEHLEDFLQRALQESPPEVVGASPSSGPGRILSVTRR